MVWKSPYHTALTRSVASVFPRNNSTPTAKAGSLMSLEHPQDTKMQAGKEAHTKEAVLYMGGGGLVLGGPSLESFSSLVMLILRMKL